MFITTPLVPLCDPTGRNGRRDHASLDRQAAFGAQVHDAKRARRRMRRTTTDSAPSAATGANTNPAVVRLAN